MKKTKVGVPEKDIGALKDDLFESMIALRASNGLSQLDLVSMTGLSQSVISRTETGQTRPTIDTVLKILCAQGYKLKIEPIKKKKSVKAK